jgi:hypothetical protein
MILYFNVSNINLLYASTCTEKKTKRKNVNVPNQNSLGFASRIVSSEKKD